MKKSTSDTNIFSRHDASVLPLHACLCVYSVELCAFLTYISFLSGSVRSFFRALSLSLVVAVRVLHFAYTIYNNGR